LRERAAEALRFANQWRNSPVNSNVMRLLSSTMLLIALALAANVPRIVGQTAPTKFDSYVNLSTDDEAAHLDLFQEALRKDAAVRGYLIGYNQISIPPGVFLRRLYGDQRYLVEMGGIDPNRVMVIEGGCRNKFTIELWLVPNESKPPAPTPTCSQRPSAERWLFDDECLECSPAVNLDLYGLTDGLKFYAAALRDNPLARGLILVRPGEHVGTRGALSEGRKAKRRLTRDFKIPSRRINVRLARRRKDNVSSAEMWVIR
jgi:hypothetical protein